MGTRHSKQKREPIRTHDIQVSLVYQGLEYEACMKLCPKTGIILGVFAKPSDPINRDTTMVNGEDLEGFLNQFIGLGSEDIRSGEFFDLFNRKDDEATFLEFRESLRLSLSQWGDLREARSGDAK